MKLILFEGPGGTRCVAFAVDAAEEKDVMDEAGVTGCRPTNVLTIAVVHGQPYDFPTGLLWVVPS